ncbi:MAG TPA: hypothetical protein V6C81_14940 [Planktothrix sp.]|jgi:hypothetical protein
MKTVRTIAAATSTKRNLIIGLSLSLLLSVCTSIVPAVADEGLSATAGALGMDGDSLLPPEVVPLDPSAASRMSQSQAQSRANDMTASTPGLANPSNAAPSLGAPGMTAQDYRKAAFDSLYNQGTLPTSATNPSFGAMQGQMGQLNNNTNSAPNGQLHQSAWAGANSPAQPQTLTGNVSQPRQANKTLKNAGRMLGAATSVAGGVAIGALMFRNGASSSAASLGLGLMGASLINAGLRGALRF